jgi:mannose-6-phosphate isomerase-like protein (cupin superfamily)
VPGFATSRSGEQEWVPAQTRVDQGRTVVDLTTQLGLQQSRARLWRYPAGASGTPHVEHAQEEVFAVLSGTLTLALGQPPERQVLPAGSVAVVRPDTPLQVRNEGADELVLLVYGAPPVTGRAEVLEAYDPG